MIAGNFMSSRTDKQQQQWQQGVLDKIQNALKLYCLGEG